MHRYKEQQTLLRSIISNSIIGNSKRVIDQVSLFSVCLLTSPQDIISGRKIHGGERAVDKKFGHLQTAS